VINQIKNLIPLFSDIPTDNTPKKKQKTFTNCLADTFNEILFERKIQLAKVQRETNIPFPTLDDWIKGKSCPLADDNLMVLSKYLGVNLEFLCYGIGSPDSIEVQAKRLAEHFNVELETVLQIMEGEKYELENLAMESIRCQLKA
jgi:hypothetical protein